MQVFKTQKLNDTLCSSVPEQATTLPKETLFYLNLRFIGVGFRGTVIKKDIDHKRLTKEQKNLATR